MQNGLDAEQLSTQSPWVSVLVLTTNESLHIERCIRSAQRLSPHVFVVDSYSTDGTAELAKKMGASVIPGNFDSFAAKLNWSLDHIDFPTPWVIRLDADEVFTDDLLTGLQRAVADAGAGINGFYLRRQLWFMGQWIKYGGMYPTYSMRLWRRGTMECEIRELDEHMTLRSGKAALLDLDIVDDPLFSLSRWIEKHNGYAALEAKLALKAAKDEDVLIKPNFFGTWAERRRWSKVKIFYRIPPFVRPVLYFFYRYIIQLGFLDGRVGFIFHFMHGLWYRCLVDAKMLELTLVRRDNQI